VKQALLMLVDELTENDRVAIVAYAGDAGLKLPPTSGDQKERIRAAIESLAAGGSTHGSAGIELAYNQVAERFIPGGANRVILATDGDLNVGITDDTALVDLIAHKAKGGTFLTVLGFGQGNLQDEKMEKLADHGNGVYAYIDGAREARKVLVEQLTGSTLTIAKDVKIQVEFDPAKVATWRLVGYENRVLAHSDFTDDTKDAGEIGAGHSVTAMYEIVPTKADTGPGPLMKVALRYKDPAGTESMPLEFDIAEGRGTSPERSNDFRFAAAVAEAGMLMRGSEHAGLATYDAAIALAKGALGPDAMGRRAEFVRLVERARDLAAKRG
jgi:Ca-activated chloride channel family protein